MTATLRSMTGGATLVVGSAAVGTIIGVLSRAVSVGDSALLFATIGSALVAGGVQQTLP